MELIHTTGHIHERDDKQPIELGQLIEIFEHYPKDTKVLIATDGNTCHNLIRVEFGGSSSSCLILIWEP